MFVDAGRVKREVYLYSLASSMSLRYQLYIDRNQQEGMLELWWDIRIINLGTTLTDYPHKLIRPERRNQLVGRDED